MSSYRKAVYHALLSCYRGEGFLSDALSSWKAAEHPSDRDFALAYEISMGTVRMTWTLDAMAAKLCTTGRMSLKLKEKVLVRMAIYQKLYMGSMPLYAIADQMVSLAKSVCHHRFVSFFNALLHKLDGFIWHPPKGNSASDISVRSSFPVEFVQWMQQDYGSRAEEILQQLNQVHVPMMRVRTGDVDGEVLFQSKMGAYVSCREVNKWSENSRVYIQNATSGYLLDALSEHLPEAPNAILDVCAAPGGKAIATHDLYPETELWVNEKSAHRSKTLEANLEKYGIAAHVTQEDGLTFSPSRHFDLIILDVPCSNTGVLAKKPEARLRLTEDHVWQLEDLQVRLLKHSAKYLKKNGQLWYMTCSILKRENEGIVEASGLQWIGEPITVLPNKEGWDGGFGVALQASAG